MEAVIILILCCVTVINGQILNPLTTGIGMGGINTGWGNGMLHSGIRYPGMMQQSHLSSMTYPTWRMHPVLRMAGVTDQSQKEGSNPISDIFNIPKIPSAHEVLTHMALANQNMRPYVDTIADFLFEPQKTRAVVTPVSSAAPVSSMSSLRSATPVASIAAMTPVQSVYVPGMSVIRTTGSVRDDCGPEEVARMERAMDWLY